MKSDTNSTNSHDITQELIPSILPFMTMRVPCPRWTWLASILTLLLFSNAFAESDFSAFWNKFRSAAIAGDKATLAEMTKFPLSMPYSVKAVKSKKDFLRRYNEIFKGEAKAAQCFATAKPRKEAAGRYEIYCPFKDTPNDWENAPIRFVFESTKTGWKFSGLDNVNE